MGLPSESCSKFPGKPDTWRKDIFASPVPAGREKDGREGKRGVIGQPAMKIEW